MLNDTIDAIGLTRDTLIFEDIVDTRVSILFGWSNLDRDNNVRDDNAKLFGIFTETDLRISTVALRQICGLRRPFYYRASKIKVSKSLHGWTPQCHAKPRLNRLRPVQILASGLLKLR